MPTAIRNSVPVQAVGETTRSSREEKCSDMFRPSEFGSPSRDSIPWKI